MSTDDGFLSRWSRRKSQVRSGEPVPELAPEAAPTASLAPTAPTASTRAAGIPALTAAPLPTAAQEPAVVPAAPEPAPLTLDDVAALTTESDFKPFVARAVNPQVRNAAMKTLFSDPHFNVMDGLDIYIDDYSKPNLLPLELARKLTSAQFMRVFDAPEPAPEPTLESIPEPSPEPAPEPTLEPASDLTTEAAVGPGPRPWLDPSPEPVPEPVPEPSSQAVPGAGSALSGPAKVVPDDAIAVAPPLSKFPTPPTEPSA